MVMKFLGNELQTYKGRLEIYAVVGVVMAVVLWLAFDYQLDAHQVANLFMVGIVVAARTVLQFQWVFLVLASASGALVVTSLRADSSTWWITSGLCVFMLLVVGLALLRMRSQMKRRALPQGVWAQLPGGEVLLDVRPEARIGQTNYCTAYAPGNPIKLPSPTPDLRIEVLPPDACVQPAVVTDKHGVPWLITATDRPQPSPA